MIADIAVIHGYAGTGRVIGKPLKRRGTEESEVLRMRHWPAFSAFGHWMGAYCDNIARRSRAETVIEQALRAGARLDMARFILLTLIAFTALAAAPPRHHAQNQKPHVPRTQAVAPQERYRALHDPHDSLWSQPAPSRYRVRVETTKGIIVLAVTRALAPRGADRFYHLVQVGFYDNSRFFRVISGRFAQFGIAGDPVIARIWQNERFPDDPVKESNVRGTFAFAMTGPDARTTQIYINMRDESRLNAMGFAPFGKVVEGMSVIDKLYAGYGETSGGGMRAGHQGKLFEQGNAYLDREFPLLDRLVRAEIIGEQK